MSYRIEKTWTFSASHQLKGLPETHQCSRLHGHNYVVVVVLEADALDDVGFVVDYGDLRPIGDFLREQWDHRHLNDDQLLGNPTAERMAEFLFDAFSDEFSALVAVRVSETPTTWAEYRA